MDAWSAEPEKELLVHVVQAGKYERAQVERRRGLIDLLTGTTLLPIAVMLSWNRAFPNAPDLFLFAALLGAVAAAFGVRAFQKRWPAWQGIFYRPAPGKSLGKSGVLVALFLFGIITLGDFLRGGLLFRLATWQTVIDGLLILGIGAAIIVQAFHVQDTLRKMAALILMAFGVAVSLGILPVGLEAASGFLIPLPFVSLGLIRMSLLSYHQLGPGKA